MNSKGLIFGLIVLAFLFSFSSCKKENQLPSCTITYPNNGDEFEQGDTIAISVEANDNDGLIAEVRFYIDNIGVFSSPSFPYGYSWNTLDETTGNHIIKVTAKDNDGGSQTDECTIFIIGNATVVTTETDSITHNSAMSEGNITDDGGTSILERGVCWNTSQNPILSNEHTTDGSGSGSFTSTMTGLIQNTTYYVRAYATNSIGTSYGNEMTFTTLNPPTVDIVVSVQCYDVTFTVEAENVDVYSWDYGDGNTSTTVGSHTYTYAESGNYTVILTVTGGGGELEITVTVLVRPTVTFTYYGTQVTYGTVEYDGKIWLDRNLGATRVASATDDSEAYGDLFQWGRAIDGHQLRTSLTIEGDMSLTSQPEEGTDEEYGKFIIPTTEPGDWADTSWTYRWLDAEGFKTTADGCPTGWRVPTIIEWQSALDAEGWTSGEDAFSSVLKLSYSGYRLWNSGIDVGGGSGGNYWSSTPIGDYAKILSFGDGGINVSTTGGSRRANAMSIRCIQE